MKQLLTLSVLILFSCGNKSYKAESVEIEEPTSQVDSGVLERPNDSVKVKQQNTSLFKQLFIPFDNESGVPFFDSEVGFLVHGFEVDIEKRFYFVSGNRSDPTVIACFDGTKEVFRKSYNDFYPSKIHNYEKTLYLFDKWPDINNLFLLNISNGEIVKSFNNIVENRVNNHYYLDSLLILNVYNLDEEVFPNAERYSVALNLSDDYLTGSLVGFTDSLSYIPEQELEDYSEYLGRWGEYRIYWNWIDTLKIVIRDSKGNTIESKEIDTDIFTNILYYDFPVDHVELADSKIYHLSQKEDQAVITILPLEKLFPGL